MTRTLKPSGNKIKKRETNTKDINKYVLIVCEDTQSCCTYLKLMAKHLRLSTTHIIDIYPGSGSAPISVAETALSKYQKSIKNKSRYEIVFCVWDIDEHTSLTQARNLLRTNNFHIIESNPCFEFWLLLHFLCYNAPITRNGNVSPGYQCEKLLKEHLPIYDKSKIEKVFDNLLQRKDNAITNAQRIRREAENTQSLNPLTNLDKLITLMENQFKNPL